MNLLKEEDQRKLKKYLYKRDLREFRKRQAYKADRDRCGCTSEGRALLFVSIVVYVLIPVGVIGLFLLVTVPTERPGDILVFLILPLIACWYAITLLIGAFILCMRLMVIAFAE